MFSGIRDLSYLQLNTSALCALCARELAEEEDLVRSLWHLKFDLIVVVNEMGVAGKVFHIWVI